MLKNGSLIIEKRLKMRGHKANGQFKKVNWTTTMIDKMIAEFPIRFAEDLAKEFGVGKSTIIRKARELKLEKEPEFLSKRKYAISALAQAAKAPNPMKGIRGWSVPNGEAYRFKKGNISPMGDLEIRERSRKSRNKTIKSEKLRIKYGLEQKTKLKLVNIY